MKLSESITESVPPRDTISTCFQSFPVALNDKDKKPPFRWKSAVPRNYKKNVIVGDLHHANKISFNLEKEISIIKAKYLKAGYPNGFIDPIIIYFHQTIEDFLIRPT